MLNIKPTIYSISAFWGTQEVRDGYDLIEWVGG